MQTFKVKTYKGMKIHYVNGRYKYDLYDDDSRWITSVNTLKAARDYITTLIWTRENIPEWLTN